MRIVKDYCCCAIPLLNAGIYITLTEQFIVAITAGILTFATPALVGASVPSFVPTVFAILCFVAAAIQLLGFLGVFRESTIIFRRYTTLHSIIMIAVFAFSASFIGVSASRHNTASSKCVTTFFPPDPSAQATALTGSDSEGKLLCNIFTWVGVGTLAGLWVVLAIFHLYLYFVISGYGSSQRDDHSKYYALYSLNSHPGSTNTAHPSYLPSDNIGMQNMGHQTETWDTRDSMDTIGFEKQNAYSQAQYPISDTTYPRHGQLSTTYPGAARTMSPAPTPAPMNYQDPYHNNMGVEGLDRPDPSVRHPGQ
ncbi:hypothetical protein BU17DRAFT_39191 [Hysterangium stoloniferum]|nr:hypothetical protein BU17DRAFT_39191 [Hysterangium stoloniferum]